VCCAWAIRDTFRMGFGWPSLYRQSTQQTSSFTRDVRAFRNGIEGFSKSDAEVVGISSDSVEWHRNFAERYDLPFTLLSDEGLR
jgi:thioredoxin-dependent peroxiredoxin